MPRVLERVSETVEGPGVLSCRGFDDEERVPGLGQALLVGEPREDLDPFPGHGRRVRGPAVVLAEFREASEGKRGPHDEKPVAARGHRGQGLVAEVVGARDVTGVEARHRKDRKGAGPLGRFRREQSDRPLEEVHRRREVALRERSGVPRG